MFQSMLHVANITYYRNCRFYVYKEIQLLMKSLHFTTVGTLVQTHLTPGKVLLFTVKGDVTKITITYTIRIYCKFLRAYIYF